MYAISFDLSISELKVHYGELYNNAYYEVKQLLLRDGFEWIQGSTYLTSSGDMTNLVRAIMDLKKIDWFRQSVRDIRGYKVEDWSNFTDLIKGN